MYSRPQDIKAEITLKRHKDYDYFVFFGYGLIITGFLEFILRISNVLIFLAFIVCIFGTGLFGLIVLVAGDIGKTYRNIDKILVTGTGIALESYQGKIEYAMPFSTVTGIRYGYREHIVSVALDLGARVPIFVQFDLTDKKKFTIPMDFIIKADQNKIFSYLPAGR